ncbi:MAG TPA: iron-containing alcohol dehydrogenase [Thermoanaerobacterales bacterium]|jgi:alcohol dehydrogenase class IV|nr:iron-containing alcohol dehydrogenase [Tepidanaerobacteraceae bacterium]HHW03059.1 iron-containing alcohol dehydrogenase [Thermoanaerobacterales bacterium]
MFKGIYSLQIPGKVIAGVDSIESLKDIIKNEKVEKALIITDKGVWNAGLVEKPIEILKSCGCNIEVINNTPPEPEVSQIEEIFKSVKSMECKMIIGIGGGSSMDTAKIISVLMTNDSSIREILGTDRIKNKGIPTLMIPTTAGTGAEATPNAIVLVPEEKLKVGIVSSKLIPDYVILDPSLTVKLPPAITANTGMDALIHAMECYISLKANPFSDTFALRAIKLISGSIRRAYNSGEDMDARHDMLIGSFYGGVCIAASGTAAVHALSYPLGSMYRIPHGLSNAILLPYVMEFNMDAAIEKYRDMAIAMGIDVNGLSSEQAAQKMVESLYDLTRDLNIKSPLREMNISERELDEIVESASKVTRLLDNNPKKLSKEDMRAIYRKII